MRSGCEMSRLSRNDSVEQEITERTEAWGWRQVELLLGREDSLKGERVGAASGGHQPLKTLCSLRSLRFPLFASASLRLRVRARLGWVGRNLATHARRERPDRVPLNVR